MSEITKEELIAMIEVQSKSAIAMESIANSVRQSSEQNKETVKLQSELVKSIQEERERCTANICLVLEKGINKATSEATVNKGIIDGIKGDTGFLKIIIGSSTLIILIVTVFLQVVTGSVQAKKQLLDLENKLIEIEKSHQVSVK